jgi:hypothetical protein
LEDGVGVICAVCGQTFVNNHYLKAHHLCYHKEFPCPICGLTIIGKNAQVCYSIWPTWCFAGDTHDGESGQSFIGVINTEGVGTTDKKAGCLTINHPLIIKRWRAKDDFDTQEPN